MYSSSRFLIQFFRFFIIGFFPIVSFSQQYMLNSSTNSTTIITCSGTFYDSGGSGSDYQNSETNTITFCSDNSGQINLNFTQFQIENNFDELYIYDGANNSSPQVIGSPFTGSNLNGLITSSGTCLTIMFDSDGSVTSSGWEAEISCSFPCQNIQGDFTTSQMPDVNSGAIQLCQNEIIDFTASATFPENNLNYPQSEATSVFTWNFGDGQSAIGINTSHSYDTEGIYITTLSIEDNTGCTNTNQIQQTIYVSTTPYFTGTNVVEDEICLGSENILEGIISPNEAVLECENTEAVELFLPDGLGGSHSSTITLDCYNPSAVLTNINDLEGICLNMEHSYVGDLEIEITCPNNQSILLLDYPNGGGTTFLGEPIDDDALPDEIGVGYDYCFTNNPTYGNLSSDLPGNSQPSGSYASDFPLTGLLGCPLNGDWTITVTDNLNQDNGYLFSWSVDLDPSLIISNDIFTPQIISESWLSDPTIVSSNNNFITVLPTTVGNQCYTYQIVDDFGCSYDTTLCFNVVAAPSSIIIDPINSLCESDSLVDITVSPIGGVWSGDVSLVGTFDPAIGIGSYTGTYTIIDSSCTYFENVVIDVLGLDDPSFTLTDFCSNSPLVANVTGTPGGVFSYNPNPNDGSNVSPTTGEIFNGIQGTTYAVEYLTQGLCNSSSIQLVTVLDSIEIINIVETCTSDQLSYIVTFDIMGGDSTTYDVSGLGALVGSTFTSDPILNGIPYNYTVSDANDCESITVSGVFTCVCLATATLSGDTAICPGDSANIVVEFEGQGPWTFEYYINGVTQATILTWNNPEIITVGSPGICGLGMVEDANCVGTVTGTADISFLETPDVINIVETSALDFLTYTVTFSITGGDPSSYNVSGAGILIGSFFASDPIPNGASYLFTVSDGNMCGSTIVSGDLTVTCPAEANIITDNISICPDDIGIIEIEFEGEAPWTFEYSIDGVMQAEITTGDNPYSLEVTTQGEYTLNSIMDANCVGTTSGVSQVDLYQLPTALISGDFIVCQGMSEQISVELTGTAAWIINYSINGIIQSPLTSLTNPSFIPSSLEGEYVIENIEDDHCINTGMGLANIEFYPDITIDFSENVEICSGEIAEIWADVNGGLPPYVYTWTSPSLINTTDTTAFLDPESSTMVELIVLDNCNIVASQSIPVAVHQLPEIGISSVQTNCGVGSIDISNTTVGIGSASSCTWIIDGDITYGCGTISHFFELGLHDVELQVTSQYGCYSDFLFEDYIEVFPVPVSEFSFGPVDATITNPLISFTNESSENAINPTWTFADEGMSNEDNPNFEFPVDNGPDEWLVCLEVNNEYGCVDISCQPVIIKGEVILMVPNTFTPNEDGLNELFYPIMSGIDPNEYEFRIFNRDGDIVFETIDINEKWNGIPDGGDSYYSTNGVYSWQIIAKAQGSSESKKYVGYILLLR